MRRLALQRRERHQLLSNLQPSPSGNNTPGQYNITANNLLSLSFYGALSSFQLGPSRRRPRRHTDRQQVGREPDYWAVLVVADRRQLRWGKRDRKNSRLASEGVCLAGSVVCVCRVGQVPKKLSPCCHPVISPHPPR